MGGGESKKKKEEAEKKRQEELERKNKIKEAITREATVKQVPKSKGWGCMIQ